MLPKNLENYCLVIFDRDGVINRKPEKESDYILAIDELVINTKIVNFIVNLQNQGLHTCVATNQQCVGKKLITFQDLSEIHAEINIHIVKAGGSSLEFFTCTHLLEEDCGCRKPKPGLLIAAMKKFNANCTNTLFIGDRISDQAAANTAGVDFVFVDDIE